MKITLANDKAQASVNTNGAFVDSFEIEDIPIFFPRLMVKIADKLKTRGGMHPCAPNFGANATGLDLDQHGFARDMDWEIDEKAQSYVRLSLDGIKDYEGVKFLVEYKLNDTSLLTSLSILNKASKEKLVAPGFHPYFYSDQGKILINNPKIDQKSLVSSIFDQNKAQKFTVQGNEIEIVGLENVNYFVFWTDFKGDYICVEPTYMANSFEDESKASYILRPGEEFVQKFEIKVKK